jgi:ABC-2 type transport system permease protein
VNAAGLMWVHARVATLDLLRSPGYVVPTIVFPAMFFAIFALPAARSSATIADYSTLSFMAWAIAGVTLYQFGVGIAAERGRPWERFLRILPASTFVRLSARIACALAFGILAAGCVAIVAVFATPINLSLTAWSMAAMYCAIGGVPFVLIGISIGYWCAVRAAVPIATACNLLLAYAGGLWMPPSELPAVVQRISPALPTRQFGELLWSVVAHGNAAPALIGLGVYTIVFGTLASIGYRRDEQRRYA